MLHNYLALAALWTVCGVTTGHAQSTNRTNSTQAQIDALRREIADLKNADRAATPKSMQQGTGQNIGGTTTRENLLDQPQAPKKKTPATNSSRKP